MTNPTGHPPEEAAMTLEESHDRLIGAAEGMDPRIIGYGRSMDPFKYQAAVDKLQQSLAAARKVAGNFPALPWVSVEERLPEYNVYVMFFALRRDELGNAWAREVRMGIYSKNCSFPNDGTGDSWVDSESSYFPFSPWEGVTHWMPMTPPLVDSQHAEKDCGNADESGGG